MIDRQWVESQICGEVGVFTYEFIHCEGPFIYRRFPCNRRPHGPSQGREHFLYVVDKRTCFKFALQNVIKGTHRYMYVYIQVTQDTFWEKYLGQNFGHLKDRLTLERSSSYHLWLHLVSVELGFLGISHNRRFICVECRDINYDKL